jgi:hypothetical protein
MGSVVPFPAPRVLGDLQQRAARGVLVPPERTGEVVILPVVQRLRPAMDTPPTLNVPLGDGL